MERRLSYEELKRVLATEPQPEGVIIADAVDELMEGYERDEATLLEERKALAAEIVSEKIKVCAEVLEEIHDRFGYVSLRRERCL